MATAYLVAFIKDNGTPYPTIVKAGIFSESAQSLTHDWKTLPVDVMKTTGKDFHEAHEKLVEFICMEGEAGKGSRFMPLDWAIPWVKNDRHSMFPLMYDKPRENAIEREKKEDYKAIRTFQKYVVALLESLTTKKTVNVAQRAIIQTALKMAQELHL